jgi:hypothetical protein
MPLNMKFSSAHSDVAAVEGAWPVMGFSSHQQIHAGPSGRVVGCSHFSRRHYGDRPAPRRRHTRRTEELRSGPAGARGLAGYHSWKLEVGLSFCRGMRPAGTPSADPRRFPPAGPWQEPIWV